MPHHRKDILVLLSDFVGVLFISLFAFVGFTGAAFMVWASIQFWLGMLGG